MAEQMESQARQAYLRLENLVVTLKLAPGSLVNEKQLIALCGLGRTPVREAIQKLEWQGLMSVRPRAGLEIAPLVKDHPQMVLQARRQLEPLAARLTAQNMNEGAKSRLIECAKTMSECGVTGDSAHFLDADKAFDEVLEETCPNPFLTQALGSLQTHSRRYWFAEANEQALDLSVMLHTRAIRALVQENPEEAERAMKDLIDGLSVG